MKIHRSEISSAVLFVTICYLFFLGCNDGKSAELPTVTLTTQNGAASTPATSNQIPQSASAVQTKAITGLPDWVYNPSELPDGLVGKSNCTFAFSPTVPAEPTKHPDSGCWEKSAPNGLVRQQFQAVHFAALGVCGGDPGDLKGIRLCGEPFQDTECGLAGPKGCANCANAFELICH